ncbi:MAG: hypothetical protein EOO53_10960 [Gammaproteobacteria bacterium]|nr:MAG: hypothetical protein EOO53_10960 [Gammaproteobacteria bacterium]
MKSIIVLSVTLLLTACSSTGVVPIGNSTYILSKKSAGCGFSSAEGTKSDLYVEANAYCEKQNKEIEAVIVNARDGVPFVRCASAELQFRCVNKK